MTINERLKNDLKEILTYGEIISAKSLEKEFGVSIRCIPTYFTGDREADTIFVNLNPGGNPEDYCAKRRFELEKSFWNNNLQGFIGFVNDFARRFGEIDENRLGAFDLKQAAFLEPWQNSGIKKVVGLQYDTICDKEKEEKELLLKQAKKNVLMQKLQLELMPYSSRTFAGIKKGNEQLLFPYLESLLKEVFRKKRKYVIFASRVFESLMRQYKDYCQKRFEISLCDELEPLQNLKKIDKKSLKYEDSSIKFSCTPIEIKYQEKKQKAIIANTFANRGLANAFGLMNQYGKFCYDVFADYVKNGACPVNNTFCKIKPRKTLRNNITL